jgi:excinuclease ABC subunit A
VIVIEHNLDVVKTADRVIDLGPLGGDRGGEVVATGTPEEVAASPRSATGLHLRPLLPQRPTAAPRPRAAPRRRRGSEPAAAAV